MQTEPEQWAVELWHAADDAAAECARDEAGYPNYAAALTIQRAFEERERKLREECDERLFWLRKAGEVLAPFSDDAAGTPTRDALVFVNAGVNRQAREAIRQALKEAPDAQ